ncbi:MAG: DUF4091 domain-containing protein [Verrucomicrobiae bacterium]|nr:DUF4091 domain-containing protein [Verrucomicrobiae bacterium]
MKYRFVILHILLLTSLIASPALCDIDNPGFEDGFRGWSGVKKDDIAGPGDSKSQNFKVEVDESIRHSGGKSVSIEYLSGPDDSYCWFQQTVKVKKGKCYKLSLHVKMENVQKTQQVHIRWPKHGTHAPYELSSGTFDWKPFTHYFVAQADVFNLSLVFVGRGKIWFDDLQLTGISDPAAQSNLILTNGTLFTCKPRQEKDDVPLGDITPAETSRGWITYVRGDPRDVYPQSIPKREEITSELKITVTPGEYGTAWFSLYALQPVEQAKIQIAGDLQSAAETIPAKNIELRTVRCWSQRTGYAATTYYIIPELLEKKDTAKVPKGSSQTFWIAVKTSGETKPGEYETKIALELDGQKKGELNLKLRVLPFKLKNPKDRHWVMWTSGKGYDKMGKDEIRRELADMKEHGINSILVSPMGFKDCKLQKNDQGNLTFTSPKLGEFQELRKELGLNSPLLLYWGAELERMAGNLIGVKDVSDNRVPAAAKTPAYQKTVKDAFQALDRFIRETGGAEYGDWYYLGMDEPGCHPQRQARSFLEHQLAHDANIKTLITISPSEFVQKVAPHVAGMCWSSGAASREKNEGRQIPDKEYWWYGSGVYTGQEGGLMPNRYLCGVEFYKTGARGQVSFIYSRPGETGDPYDDFDGASHSEPKDLFIAYPSADGPVSTLQWEGIHEGIVDYKYLSTLEDLIAAAKRSGKKELVEMGIATEKKLKTLIEELPWESIRMPKDVDNARVSAFRETVISLILELRNLSTVNAR